jgi:hypothetical protein
MGKKGLSTTVQESKGKFTTTIPMGIVHLKDIEKGDKLLWSLDNDKIVVKVRKG